MEVLVRRQNLLFESLQNSKRNYQKDPKNRKTEIYYKKRLESTYEWWVEFDAGHKEILQALIVVNPPECQEKYFSDEVYSNAEEYYLTFVAELEEKVYGGAPVVIGTRDEEPVQQNQPDINPPTVGCNESNSLVVSGDTSSIKLPRITLPKFSGDYTSWVSFRDLYIALIHNKHSLSNAEKLHYLKASLAGEAERLVQGYAVTEANYESAWQTLLNRYENKKILVKSQLDLLFNHAHCHETSESIKGLLDVTFESVQALENLKISNLWETVIIYMTVRKLPKETLQLWEQDISDTLNLPTFKTLKSFLEMRFRTLEAIESSKPKSSNINRKPGQIRRQTFFVKGKLSCGICGEEHIAKHCNEFIKLSFAERNDTIKRLGLCINCLNKGHLVSACPSRFACNHCGKRHHTLMHIFNSPANSTVKPQLRFNASEFSPSTSNDTPQATTSNIVQSMHVHLQKQVLLATALVTLRGPSGVKQQFRALLDQGSQATFVTENVVQALRLKREPTNALISGIGQTGSELAKSKASVQLIPRRKENPFFFEAFVLKTIANNLPHRIVATDDWHYLHGLDLADPTFNMPGRIDVLLGADIYARLILDGTRRGSPRYPIALNSILGWVLCGEVSGEVGQPQRILTANVLINISDQLQRFWELEEPPIAHKLKPEDAACEEHFVKHHKRLHDGTYSVKLPFINDERRMSLGASRNSAVSSFLHLERKFEGNNKLKADYSKCINEYLTLGHMHTVQTSDLLRESELSSSMYYLPHHAVFKESTTTRLRVVFDASRKTSTGLSLNDVLMTGPAIQNNLTDVLLQWRWHRYCFMGDIEKMYRQVKVHPDDANYQRIIWRDDSTKDIKDYCLSTVTFGVTCAPYLAIRVLQQLSIDERERFPIGAEALAHDFYVDDLLSGDDTIQKTKEKQRQLNSLLHAGGFKLRKWVANNLEILKDIPREDQATAENVNLSLDSGIKSLGLMWYPKRDALGYKVGIDINRKVSTKRELLSEIAKLYDPLGWISPVVMVAKSLMQAVWIHGTDWDEDLPESLSTKWLEFKATIMDLENLRIPRWLNTSTSIKAIEIHAFSDASLEAYAAAIYIKTSSQSGTSHTHLLISKSKVKPIKQVSIPRLELCGVVLASRLIRHIRNISRFSDLKIHLWTDSMIVLAWLNSHPTKWKMFVANRTSEILEILGDSPRHYVPSEDNPADIASRGLSAPELINSELWWHGPKWLHLDNSNWPVQPSLPTKPEEAKIVKVNICTKTDHMMEILNKYSSLSKLIRVTAHCLRFCQRSKRLPSQSGWIKSNERSSALKSWIKFIQAREFIDDIHNLQTTQRITKRSKLVKLHPFLDDEGLLRVGGRLENSDLDYDECHPIIIPNCGHFVDLLLQYYHHLTLHGGSQLMLAVFRKRYWLLNARNIIRNFLYKCITCYRQKADTSSQLMGNLPSYRVVKSRPFSNSGVDYCGPILLKMSTHRKAPTYKGYIAIFVCLAVKAVHIEPVSDMTTSAFIAAFRRFVARRGLVRNMYSDCGTNFVGANVVLQDIQKGNRAIAQEFANEGVDWHFIPPSAPHFGGLWESCVKRAKYHLKRIVGSDILTFEELCTVLTQVEACMNSTPLCPLTANPDEIAVLTPGHFLIGDALLSLSQTDLSDVNTNRLDRWQLSQKLLQHFWSRWTNEYLHQLQQRHKWTNPQPNISKGTIVLVKDDRLPPNKWPLALVVETHPGNDGFVRVVSVKLRNSITKRPITKLAVLPISDNETENNKDKSNEK